MRTAATAVRVMKVCDVGLKTLTRLSEVKIDVYITEGRLALACEKYDKGGGLAGASGRQYRELFEAGTAGSGRRSV